MSQSLTLYQAATKCSDTSRSLMSYRRKASENPVRYRPELYQLRYITLSHPLPLPLPFLSLSHSAGAESGLPGEPGAALLPPESTITLLTLFVLATGSGDGLEHEIFFTFACRGAIAVLRGEFSHVQGCLSYVVQNQPGKATCSCLTAPLRLLVRYNRNSAGVTLPTGNKERQEAFFFCPFSY